MIPPSATPAFPAPDGRPAIVLVVDDAAADRDLHCLAVRTWGLHAVAAADGWEALVCARTLLPDLVIADVRMPRLDGWGLVARLRAAPETARIPVLLVTADAGATRAARLETTAGVALLAKPLDLRALRDAAARALAGAAGSQSGAA